MRLFGDDPLEMVRKKWDCLGPCDGGAANGLYLGPAGLLGPPARETRARSPRYTRAVRNGAQGIVPNQRAAEFEQPIAGQSDGE